MYVDGEGEWSVHFVARWLRERRPRIYAKIERGFVPRALRRLPAATARTARAARRRAVARKARI